jgi:hypothetical protein
MHGSFQSVPEMFVDAPHTASEQVCEEFSSRESWCGSTQACNRIKLHTVQSEQNQVKTPAQISKVEQHHSAAAQIL